MSRHQLHQPAEPIPSGAAGRRPQHRAAKRGAVDDLRFTAWFLTMTAAALADAAASTLARASRVRRRQDPSR